MAFDLSKLRVICMRCPAVATLFLVELEAYQDAVLIWCECHDEHVLAVVDGNVLHGDKMRDPATGHVNLNMQALRLLDRDEVQRRHEETMHVFGMVSKRLEAFRHFLAVPQEQG